MLKPTACGNKVRASCCVSVLAPAGRDVFRPAATSAAARRMSRLTAAMMCEMLSPKCVLKSPSSAAMIAWRSCGAMPSYPTIEAPLHGKLADELAARRINPRDRARSVVVERRDLGEVAGISEHDAAQGACGGRCQKQGDDDCAAREADDEMHLLILAPSRASRVASARPAAGRRGRRTGRRGSG